MVSVNNGNGTSTIMMVDGSNTALVSELAVMPYVPVALYTPNAAEEAPSEDQPMMTQLLGLEIQAQTITFDR